MPENIQISEPSLGEEEWLALREPLESGWLTQGPKVAEFERAFAERHQVAHAVATSSCTTALHLMLAAAGIGPGDEVIVPSFTWVSTANAVIYVGATPVLADVDISTYNIDLEDVQRKLTPRTRAVIAVHLFGLCVDIEALKSALPSHVVVFEDAACAAGASIDGKSAGSLALAAAFSFHPRKSITTGEGGMLTTNDDEVAETARRLRNHGASISEEQRHRGPAPYLLPEFGELGFNYRMTDLQGAMGVVQLSKLDSFITERTGAADEYIQSLGEIPWLEVPKQPMRGSHAWQAFVVRITGTDSHHRRNSLMQRLQEAGIATRPGTHAVHSLAFYSRLLGQSDLDLPSSALCRDTTMALPLHNRMTGIHYAQVVNAIASMSG